MSLALRRLLEASLLFAVLALAAVLRFHSLASRGLIYWDEGKFSLEGLRFLAIFSGIVHLHAPLLAGKAVGTAKPMHAVFVSLAYTLFGVHDYVPLYMSGVASVISVLLLWLIARRLFDPVVALVAALFLSVSQYDAIYARSALSEADATAMLLGGVAVWLLSLPRETNGRFNVPGRATLYRSIGAVLLGIGFTTNYRLAVYIAAVIAMDLLILARRGPTRDVALAAAQWASGIAAPLLVWQTIGLLSHSHGTVLFRSEVSGRAQTYLSEVLYQLHGGKQGTSRFNPSIYIQWYTTRQGYPMLFLVGIGLLCACIRRSPRWILPGVLVFIPYLSFSFAPFIVPRNLESAIPFSSLLAAAVSIGAVRLIPFRAARTSLLVIVIVAFTFFGARMTWTLGSQRSGFALAAQYVQSHAAKVVGSNEILVFYFRRNATTCVITPLGTSLSDLAAARAAGYQYAIVDVYNTPAKRFLLAHGRRVARYLVTDTSELHENPVASENGSEPGTSLHQHVDVYLLSGLHLSTVSPHRIPPCSQDQVA